MESLGIRLKKLRKDKGLTQVELGKLSGVTGVTIGYWEKDLNEPGSKALSKLAQALGTTESYLLYGVSSPELSFVQSNPGTKIPYFSWGDAISFLILEGEKTMGNVDRITTFFDVVEGDFAVGFFYRIVFKEIPSAFFRIIRIYGGIGFKNAAHYLVCYGSVQLLTLCYGELFGTLHRAACIAKNFVVGGYILAVTVPCLCRFALPCVVIACHSNKVNI